MFETTEDQASPRIRQISVFLENRLGALLSVTRTLEDEQVNVWGMSITDAADHAIVRLIVDRPSMAAAALGAGGYHIMDSELIAVALPASKVGGMSRLLKALLMAELNVNYMYAFVPGTGAQRAAVAIHVEDPERAARALVESGLALVGQDELR